MRDHAKLDQFTIAYIEAALWCESDDAGTALDRTGLELSPEAAKSMADDCAKFQAANRTLLDQANDEGNDDAQLGHDFYFTRNHHGVGYWEDNYSKALGDALTKAAHSFGFCMVYVGDSGSIEYTSN